MSSPPTAETARETDPAPSGARLPAVLAVLVALAWPLFVWLGLRSAQPRTVAVGAFAAIGLVALLGGRDGRLAAARPFAPALVLTLLSAASGDPLFLLAQPVLMNLAIAFAFGISLRRGSMPMIERFARRIGEPRPGGKEHCRTFTIVWTVFALSNAGVAAWLALRGDTDLWAAWTGGGSYVAIGLLIVVERIVRRWRFGPMPQNARRNATVPRHTA